MDYDVCTSLPAMFFANTAEIGDRGFLWERCDGAWKPVSGAQARSDAAALSNALKSLGVVKGDRIALISENRPEWLIADIGIMAAGAISVPAYVTNQVSDHLHILGDSGAKGAIVSGPALARNLLPAAREAGLDFIITMAPLDGDMGGPAIHLWSDLLGAQDGTAPATPDLSAISRTDTACLIYTSGTGGTPKGVMLSHGAILSNCKGAYHLLLGFGLDDEVFLSFLPLSHSYEHTAGLMFPLSINAEIYYAESIDKLAANMEEVKPTIMTAVPRLYETMYGKIIRGVQQKGGLSEKLFMKAVATGRKKYEGTRLSLGESLIDPVLTKLVRKKVAGRFGGRLKAMVSGGAPLNYEVGVFFKALDVELLQGYGQTESAPIISCNPPANNKMRTVGPPFVDIDLKIADDGEILVRGELVMQGYWNNPEATAEAISDGWLHTGDIGELDEHGHLKITDRKKDIIVNSGGDNIAPQRIEGFLELQPEIAQSMVYGDRKPNIVALIVPQQEFASDWAKANGKKPDMAALVEDADFRKAISAAIDRVNTDMSVIERIRKFILTAEPFTTDNGMMTPSMKIRRHVIRENFGDALEALYPR
ncbi:MAG: long-chain fatty acid--CoA ligase [Rhodospirillaceae bacterium]|jgi:long-chain acyl-CoA synthetase|nr:long-chain fatty acid--CoA ligase [Rhodospirillaceae bacterium]